MGRNARACSGARSKTFTCARCVCAGTASTISQGITTCFSCGSTSRNQPTQPANIRIAPSTLTAALVTRPAMSSMNPKASVIGHAVGCGITIPLRSAFEARCSLLIANESSASGYIDHKKNDDPNHINEMPVERQHVHAFVVLLLHPAKQRKRENEREAEQADRDVKCVQTHERVVGGAKQVGLDREAFVINQVMPLAGGADEENRAKRDGERPKRRKYSAIHFFQRAKREVNREAAREQANRIENRQLENFARRGTGDALANVKNVHHDKNREDRRLRSDQAEHADFATRGQNPRRLDRRWRKGRR